MLLHLLCFISADVFTYCMINAPPERENHSEHTPQTSTFFSSSHLHIQGLCTDPLPDNKHKAQNLKAQNKGKIGYKAS